MPFPVRFIAPDFNNNVNNYSLNRNYVLDTNNPEFQNGLTAQNDFQNKISFLGNPIYDSIELFYHNDNYNAVNASDIGGKSQHRFAEFQIVKFSVAQTRNVITTSVNGLNGTIKEYIADGDYIISCSALMVFEGIDYYDYDFMQDIQGLFLIQDSINIESNIINNVFNIFSVVVTDYKFSQPEAGMRNVQSVDFTLISDNQANYNLIFP